MCVCGFGFSEVWGKGGAGEESHLGGGGKHWGNRREVDPLKEDEFERPTRMCLTFDGKKRSV